MARISFISFFLLSLIAISFVTSNAGGEGSIPLQGCPRECERRCELAKGHEDCIKYCNICCEKCLCVPSGTSGNKQECPCYNNWKSTQGKSKCP